jgi:hypothetical protein
VILLLSYTVTVENSSAATLGPSSHVSHACLMLQLLHVACAPSMIEMIDRIDPFAPETTAVAYEYYTSVRHRRACRRRSRRVLTLTYHS